MAFTPNKSISTSAGNRVVWTQKKWYAGMSNFPKEDYPFGFARSQAIDFRTTSYVGLMPAALKESGSVVTDLVQWFDTTPFNLVTYAYGDTGNLYSRSSSGSWTLLRSVAGSHGNGLGYFFGDDYLYYTTDTAIGRYGMLQGATQTYNDNFLASVGSVPQNTNSLSLLSASSQYATAADSASLSITSDLTLEAFFNATTLPAVGASTTLIGKWDESTNARSYKMDIFGISGFFGDGSDGSLTVSSPTTQAPTDSACSGTVGTQTLTATNASFAAGKPILIVQMQGATAGASERNTIQSYTAGTITTQTPLRNTYTSPAQVIQLPQYTNVTVSSTWTAKAWNGTTGGILPFLYSGTLSGAGTISADSCGFRGGTSSVNNGNQTQGEGTLGLGSRSTLPNGNGGGAGIDFENNAAGGGGNGFPGGTGTARPGKSTNNSGQGGLVAGASDLSSMVPGGGGGATAYGGGHGGAGIAGGLGGGIIAPWGVSFAFTGIITANGANGSAVFEGASAGGAGGSINLKAQTFAAGATIRAIGGSGAIGGGTPTITSGNGGDGRIAIAYLTSNAATASPTATVIQDNTLVTTTTYQARLGVSSTGTNSEFLTQNIPTLTTTVWNRLSITWAASTATATFYLNATPIGTSVGTLTAINNNASLLYLGANKTSVVANFFNGLIDDVRIWNSVQTAAQIFTNNLTQVSATSAKLQAYWQLNAVATDATTNANNLTLVNAPTYSTSVPFQDQTTRLDIDQSYTVVGDTYALGTTISESLANQLPFTPALDPQKSIDFNISAKGTGDWTVTIHDQQNNVVATQTITNANLASSGYQMFTFTSPWRIVINKSYHAHITSTVADGSIVASTHNSLQSGGLATGDFHTYYQFLVTDTKFHPIARFLNKLVVGNERYLATWDGASYNPNLIAFPPQTHVRCFAFWRQYLAIGTWQEPTTGEANIYDWSAGKIYFWDGISLTFNNQIDVPEGQINSMLGLDSDLYYFAGSRAELYLYQGSYMSTTGNGKGNLVRRIPSLKPHEYLEVNPMALASWRGLLHFGLAVNASADLLQRGTWSYGAWQPGYPQALSMDYPISTGNTGTTVSVGAVYPIGQTLLQSWGDNGAYGVDQINFNNQATNYAFLEANVQDLDVMWHDKEALKARADHLALGSGNSVVVKYAIDQGQFESANSLTDSSSIIHPTYVGSGRITTNSISDGRGLEFQVAIEMRQTLNAPPDQTGPIILALSALASNLLSETVF